MNWWNVMKILLNTFHAYGNVMNQTFGPHIQLNKVQHMNINDALKDAFERLSGWIFREYHVLANLTTPIINSSLQILHAP
jgi:hypothetical protein